MADASRDQEMLGFVSHNKELRFFFFLSVEGFGWGNNMIRVIFSPD